MGATGDGTCGSDMGSPGGVSDHGGDTTICGVSAEGHA